MRLMETDTMAQARMPVRARIPRLTRLSWKERVPMTAYSHFPAEEGYQAVAQMPLPEAAVVIDVRQLHLDEGDVLLAHLQTELADLTAEMQAAQVPAWSHLLEIGRAH